MAPNRNPRGNPVAATGDHPTALLPTNLPVSESDFWHSRGGCTRCHTRDGRYCRCQKGENRFHCWGQKKVCAAKIDLIILAKLT